MFFHFSINAYVELGIFELYAFLIDFFLTEDFGNGTSKEHGLPPTSYLFPQSI